MENTKLCNHFEKSLTVLYTLKQILMALILISWEVLHKKSFPKEIKIYIHKKTYTRIPVAALFII